MVDFIGIERVRQLVGKVGAANFIRGLAHEIETDCRGWQDFEKTTRHATRV